MCFPRSWYNKTNFDLGIRETFEQEGKRESDYQDTAKRGVELSHIAAALIPDEDYS